MKIEIVEQAIATIEFSGYDVTKITNQYDDPKYDKYKHLIANGWWLVLHVIERLDNNCILSDWIEPMTADELIEFARKCQLKAFW